MAPFSLPAPAIIPLRLPVIGGPKSIDTNTKVQLLCESYLEHEMFYTLDGTKPQPYAGIVQGNKTIKYTSPFCLPAGKITIKALAIHASVHTMCSSVVTKQFVVSKVESEDDDDKTSNKAKQKSAKTKKKSEALENNKNSDKKIAVLEDKLPDITIDKLDSDLFKDEDTHLKCMEEAFIGGSDFDIENSELEDSIPDESAFPASEDVPDANGNIEEFGELMFPDVEGASYHKDSLCEAMEKLGLEEEKNMDKGNVTLTDSGTSNDTRFCCLKCDLTLQQCVSCNKMNAVSSKFCIECGEQLIQRCFFCKEDNPNAAIFCQYCGKKLGTRLEPFIRLDQVDHGVMAKPQSKNVSIQKLPKMMDKYTQTLNDRSPIKNKSDVKRTPRHSPGRGYWHQQLDYICNHLKSHAYNNVEFRKEISEPSLCDFKSAHIIKNENSIAVTVVFTPLVANKNGLTSSEGTNSKKQDST